MDDAPEIDRDAAAHDLATPDPAVKRTLDSEVMFEKTACVDLRDKSRLERERDQLRLNEQSLRLQLQQSEQLRDQFLSWVAHEIRTPLNAIVGWSQILNESNLDDKDDLREGLEVIHRNANAQTKIIDRLLDINRILSGKVQLDRGRVDVSAVIHSAVESLQSIADVRGVHLQEEPVSFAGTVQGDHARILQVIRHLLSNAVHFTPKDGHVRIRAERKDTEVEIEVADTGDGIDADFIRYLFERFRPSEPTSARKHGNLGLGLPMVKRLIDLHHGTIDVHSGGKGKGTTFRVRLPTESNPTLEPDENPESPDLTKTERPEPSGRVQLSTRTGIFRSAQNGSDGSTAPF